MCTTSLELYLAGRMGDRHTRKVPVVLTNTHFGGARGIFVMFADLTLDFLLSTVACVLVTPLAHIE